MKVSVIIRCFNEEEHIGKLLTGLENQKGVETEVIVVDSGSTDSTVTIASKFDARIIKIKPEEFSFGYALNVGCEAATGDILLFASAHVYPLYDDWLDLMSKPFINDTEVALVYGKQRGDYRNKFSEHQIFKQWFPETSNYNQEVAFCNNANCAVRASLWRNRKFDELLTGLEDLDWATDMKRSGYKLVYEAKATIIHVHEEKASQVYNRYKREAIALKKIKPESSFSFIDLVRLMTINILHDLRQAFSEKKLVEHLVDIFTFRYNQFVGTYKGYIETETQLNKELRNRYYYPPYLHNEEKNNSQKRIDYGE